MTTPDEKTPRLEQQGDPPRPSAPAEKWKPAGLAVGVALLEVAVAVVGNLLTTAVNAITISFVVLVSLLVVLVTANARPDLTGQVSRLRRLTQSRWWPALMVSTVTWILVTCVLYFGAIRQGDHQDNLVEAATCSFRTTDPGAVQPVPATSIGLTFCPTRVNYGKPITGPFQLEGETLGSVETRRRLLLAVMPDPSTCSTLGVHGSGTYFVLDTLSMASEDGKWSYADDLGGFKPGVTLGRFFTYIQASPESLDRLRNDHASYNASGSDPRFYGGVKQLPDDARVVAKFYVPGGLYKGKPYTCPAEPTP